MKKNILFIIPSLCAGGGERSLLNLLNEIDYKLYNVDLFLLNHNGMFMEFIPREVNVVPLLEKFRIFKLPLNTSIISFLTKGNITLAYNRFMFSLKNRTSNNISQKEQYTWKYLSKALDELNKEYDVAIGYLEKTSTYFCVEKVKAKKKIGWVHIDYDKLGMDPNFDISYFSKLDNIITVSEECANVLKKIFPKEEKKIKVIYNINSAATINKLALENLDINKKSEEEIMLLTIGRLHYQKGLEMAIEACSLLMNKGYNIRWYVIGEGEERNSLQKLIKEKHLEDNFVLLGLKPNPYPYIKQTDIYVQPSRFEGKSIAIDEAKILCKPIVVTNFSTAKDQITNGENGIIVDMDPKEIANGVELLIKDESIRKKLSSNLSKLSLGTEAEIDKLYDLLIDKSDNIRS
ncbi:glycosyl transferase [Clostridium polyendosporum]|uniref:Glycosyl transferase n=1 Tax=Clostridium polyendosporum TaxID=69208 RepID=A0A919VGL0_9CLOT|nr:glycosyltransferase [Clostridium polyendosporum]GIM28741.1 glycosyl transferase [Clostridium polyendosporum]